MYPRTTGGIPILGTVLIGVALVFGVYLMWNGLMTYVAAHGDITAPMTARAADQATQTQQIVIALITPTQRPTATPPRPCAQFKVRGVNTIVHECAKLSCATLSTILQPDQTVCVYGVEPSATDWYIVNLDPGNLYPHLSYVHRSVLYPLNPTQIPTRTLAHPPTVTAVPTLSGLATITPTAHK